MKRFKFGIALLAIIITGLMIFGFDPSATAGSWKFYCVADSLDLTSILGDTVIQVADWSNTNDVGRIAFCIREIGVTTTDVEATYNFKTVLREKDGEVDTLQAHFYEGSTAKTAAVDLLGTSNLWGAVGEKSGLYIEAPYVFGGKVFLFLTKNDCDAGFIDVYTWQKQE